MNTTNPKLTLDRPVTYEITVPGHLDETWADWVERVARSTDPESEGTPVTTLTTTVDQAGLQGVLRRLYSLGVPLISVIWLRPNPKHDAGQPAD